MLSAPSKESLRPVQKDIKYMSDRPGQIRVHLEKMVPSTSDHGRLLGAVQLFLDLSVSASTVKATRGVCVLRQQLATAGAAARRC